MPCGKTYAFLRISGVRLAACNTDSDDDIVNLGVEYRDVNPLSVAKEELSIVAAKEEAVNCE